MNSMLDRLFSYQAWANDAFFDKIGILSASGQDAEVRDAIRLMNHCRLVSEIFAAHLDGRVHGHSSNSQDDVPDLADLRMATAALDRWYLDYGRRIPPERLVEMVSFTFTDGDKGFMSREEMLTHVLLHCGYHRGEVGRILTRCSIETPWDTFAVFLHRTQPARRSQGTAALP